MRVRTVVYILVLLIVLAFLLDNWRTISNPTDLNFFFARIHAPVGVLILLVAAAIGAIALVAHGLARYAWRRERRGLAQEIEQLRARSEIVQESHLQELRQVVERETTAIRSQLERLLANQR
ncbi:MAG TPA: LapA family protein [Steroidobacteraceae bacterium]|nr:LapA family protein [Steroidobacteraceae bacterium]